MDRRNTGRLGEQHALMFLKQKSYDILDVNWRYSRLGEVDIIAYHPLSHTLAFIEVKTRRSDRFGSGIEAITLIKQQRLTQLAEIYLQIKDVPPYEALSFDVIVVTPNPNTPEHPSIQHTTNAF